MPKNQEDIQPTHEYRFTHNIVFQFSSKEYLVRVLDLDRSDTGEWFQPTMVIDLNKFTLLPHQVKSPSRMQAKREALSRLYHPMAFLGRWRKKLKDDQDYADFLEEVRCLMIYAQTTFREAQVRKQHPDITGDNLITQMIDSVDTELPNIK
jgi:hypothetical protein